MNWLHTLNLAVLQWLCVRLARKVDEHGNHSGWTLLRWVRPLSGYGGRPWKFIGQLERSK